MSPRIRGRTSPVVKPAPEKKTKAKKTADRAVDAKDVKGLKFTPASVEKPAPPKQATKPAPAKPQASKSKPPSKRMHPEAIKRRDARLEVKAAPKPKPSPPISGLQMDVPLVARKIPTDPYTIVYAGSLLWLDSKKVRHKLQRGETIQLTQAGYEVCSDVMKRALVKGNLTMEEIHALLKQSRGQVPGAVAYGLNPLTAIDFASALPVKDQESQATTVSLALPNFTFMSNDDIKAWAGQPAVRAWLGDLPDGKKHELVAAIVSQAAKFEAGPGVKPTAPDGAFEDV